MHKVVTSSSGSTSLLPQQTITVWVVGYAGQRTRSTGGQRLITNGARKLAPNHQEAPWGPPVLTALNYRAPPLCCCRFHVSSLALLSAESLKMFLWVCQFPDDVFTSVSARYKARARTQLTLSISIELPLLLEGRQLCLRCYPNQYQPSWHCQRSA